MEVATSRPIKFRNWGDWSPALAETNVGANDTWHTIKLSFSGSTITAYYDGVLQSGLTSTDASYASGGVDIDYWTGNTSGPSYNDFVVRDAADAILFQDNFGADPVPAPSNLPPWQSVNGTWSITGGILSGSGGYGNVQYVPPTSPQSDYVVDSRIKFTAGSHGGGIGGRLDPATGAHYGIWLYPTGTSDGRLTTSSSSSSRAGPPGAGRRWPALASRSTRTGTT